MSERAEGYYWVRDARGWQVAEWSPRTIGCFYLCGHEDMFDEDDFIEIGPYIGDSKGPGTPMAGRGSGIWVMRQ